MEAIRPDTPPLEAEPYGLTRMGEALASGFRTRGHSRQSAGSIEKQQSQPYRLAHDQARFVAPSIVARSSSLNRSLGTNQRCRCFVGAHSLAGDQHERDHVQRDALSLVAQSGS